MDGGKGQLGRAVSVLERFDLTGRVPVVGLAKQHEELFLPGRAESLLLPRHSQGLYLVQRIRDEAHRFAITAHRKRRSREGLASRLDKIQGIGPGRRKALLIRFGSLERIQQASLEELTSIRGHHRGDRHGAQGGAGSGLGIADWTYRRGFSRLLVYFTCFMAKAIRAASL